MYSRVFKQEFKYGAVVSVVLLATLGTGWFLLKNKAYLALPALLSLTVCAFYFARIMRKEISTQLWLDMVERVRRLNLETLLDLDLTLLAARAGSIEFSADDTMFLCHLRGTRFEMNWTDTTNTQQVDDIANRIRDAIGQDYRKRGSTMLQFLRELSRGPVRP